MATEYHAHDFGDDAKGNPIATGIVTTTEMPPDIRARAERINAEFLEMLAPFDDLTPTQQREALVWFIGWVGSAAARGDEDAAACFAGALKAARRVQ
jgi:hypothetical protein